MTPVWDTTASLCSSPTIDQSIVWGSCKPPLVAPPWSAFRDHSCKAGIDDRVAQYRDQTQRYLAGEISEAEFLPLRLQNGLYVQRLAPMLRIAIPYGMLSTRQLRKLAEISRGLFTIETELATKSFRIQNQASGKYLARHPVATGCTTTCYADFELHDKGEGYYYFKVSGQNRGIGTALD